MQRNVLAALITVLSLGVSSPADTIVLHGSTTGQGVNLTINNTVPGEWYRIASSQGLGDPLQQVSAPMVATNETTTTNLPVNRTESSRFYTAVWDAGGANIVTKGDPLYVWDTNSWAVTVRPDSDGQPVEMFALYDIVGGETKLIDSVYGSNLTESTFTEDTAYLPNGPQQLYMAAFEGIGTSDPDTEPTEYDSAPTSIFVTNAIYFAPNVAKQVGWMLVVQFQTVTNIGTYEVDISAISGGVSTPYGGSEGDLSDADTNGVITVQDGYIWDDSIGDYRQRNPYDGYPGIDAFDVVITVNPTASNANAKRYARANASGSKAPQLPGPPWQKKYRMVTQGSAGQRISSVVEDRGALHLADDSIDRVLLDSLLDSWYTGLAYISPHWDFTAGNLNQNQQPDTQGWVKMDGPMNWQQYNYALACHPTGNATYPNAYQITHLYSFTHGNPKGLHSYQSGSGLGYEVTAQNLLQLGFVQTNGLTFGFLDACDAFKDGAPLPTLIMQNSGVRVHISLDEIATQGIRPNFCVGWTIAKAIGFNGNSVYVDHITYSGSYVQWLIDPDPATGLPQFTYAEVRARSLTNPDGSANVAGRLGYEWVGCQDLKIYY